MQSQVFISYSSTDQGAAQYFLQALLEADFDVWLDKGRLNGGTEWKEEIDEAIRESSVIIFLVSPRSVKSDYVTYEWAFALGAGKHIIPVIWEQAPVHPRLQHKQHIDFTNRRSPPFSDLIQSIQAYLNPQLDCIQSQTSPETRKALISLVHGNTEERQVGLKKLRDLKDPKSIQCLIKFICGIELSESESDEIIRVLVDIGDKVFHELVEKLGSHNATTRHRIAYALGQLRNPQALSHLDALLGDSEPEVRISAAKALGHLRNTNGIAYLIKHFDEDQHDGVRAAIAEALGMLASIQSVNLTPIIECLNKGLKDKSLKVVKKVVQALGETRDERTDKILLDFADNFREVYKQPPYKGDVQALYDALEKALEKSADFRG